MLPEIVTDEQRFPGLTEHGRQMIEDLREHPHAPRFSARSGHRLTEASKQRVREYEQEVECAPEGWEEGALPAWIGDFLTRCLEDVPFYRRYDMASFDVESLPTCDRADLARESWSFVPDSLPLDELIIYSTSSTSGHPLILPSHPLVAGCYLPLLKKALGRCGVELAGGRGRVGFIMLGYQRTCFTYVSVTPALDEAGFAKINLHPDDWRHPDDRSRFLESCQAEVLSGDPISLFELMQLPAALQPKAVLSTSMTLLPGLKSQLEDRFQCPVVDLYSTNESGPIGMREGDAYALLQPRLYVEILDAEGRVCPTGDRGEITITGGFNPYLPLLRYRTGDYASLAYHDRAPRLEGFEGRPPVVFRGTGAQRINNIEVTHALKSFAIPQFILHQAEDGSLRMRLRGAPVDETRLRKALAALFGNEQRLTLEYVATFEGKVIQYTTAIGEA